MVHYIYMLWKGMYFKDKEQVLSLYFVISQLLNSVFSSIKWTFKNIKLICSHGENLYMRVIYKLSNVPYVVCLCAYVHVPVCLQQFLLTWLSDSAGANRKNLSVTKQKSKK